MRICQSIEWLKKDVANKKGAGLAVFVRKGCGFGCEWLDVGDSDMSKDMIERLEYVENGKREYLYVCVCYMTVVGANN